MTRRIAVFGTESTGKTTLAQQLAQHFGVPWAAEYVREFWYERNAHIEADDLDAIARGQIANENHASARTDSFIICDTELITNTLWADLLFPGRCPDWVRRQANRRCHHYSLYVLCDADVAYVEDGPRCFPDAARREQCRQLWRHALVRRDLPFVTLRGTWQQRFTRAVAAIENALEMSSQ